ncbi:MAG TPA: S-methyl-5'-thioadenosine phosphorylase [Polyangiaceae bacterium]|nr:S-methyl-5'-thioadenosine phosphorylase [Polyangiaceae bacterium]
MPPDATLAVFGGSGLYEIDGLSHVEELRVETPFGPPSDVVVRGRLGATTLLFLPRHGRGHRLAPHEINFRANVCAVKMLGATHLVSMSAVGSMREAIVPGDFVVVDQFIDLTRRRVSTFFDQGLVAHVGFADPVCDRLSAAAADAAVKAGARVHEGGTYVCIDGPQFSTRAESSLYRSWGASVIGMTAMPEAKLAREAELPYALVALATDYDCWHASEADVTVQAVLAVLQANVRAARRTVVELAAALPDVAESRASRALESALITSREAIPPSALARLDWLVGKYLC